MERRQSSLRARSLGLRGLRPRVDDRARQGLRRVAQAPGNGGVIMTMNAAEKVRENRLRRVADRRGLRLVKSPRRDPRALDYGTYQLVDLRTNHAASQALSLNEVEAYLTHPKVNQ